MPYYPWRYPRENPELPCRQGANCPYTAAVQEAAQQTARLGQLQKKLAEDSRALALQKSRLEQEANKLSQWQQALLARERALAAKAEQTQQEAPKPDSRLIALQEATRRYRHERELWEACRKQQPSAATGVEEELDTVKRSFMNIQAELKQARENLLLLNDTVSHSAREGVAQRCRLYRDMAFSDQEALVLQSNRLGAILQSEFGAEPLEPCPGDRYDSTCHERTDTARSGETILCCRARGWRWKEDILMRAVVDTEERNEQS